MKLHIKIPKITDFFFVVSKEDPTKTEIVEVEKKSNPTQFDEEQMEHNLDRINMWIGNCDQKASFLLAFVGVSATIFITSDVITKIKELLVDPFISYWFRDIGAFNTFRFIIAVCLVVSVVCFIITLVNLLLCLMAKTDYSKFKQPGMVEKSHLFYVHIASMTFEEFCQWNNDQLNDLRSQTYTNARICTDKFKYYKRSIISVLVALPLLTIALALILFV